MARSPRIAQRRPRPPPSGGNCPESLLLALLEVLHVEIACGFEPVRMGLGGKGSNETQAAGGIRKDADHQGPALALLIEPLQPVRRLHMLVARPREAIVGQSLFDVVL